MYYVFQEGEPVKVYDKWPSWLEVVNIEPEEKVYVVVTNSIYRGYGIKYYLVRRHTGSIPINLSDVPNEYIAYIKMLDLVLPKG